MSWARGSITVFEPLKHGVNESIAVGERVVLVDLAVIDWHSKERHERLVDEWGHLQVFLCLHQQHAIGRDNLAHGFARVELLLDEFDVCNRIFNLQRLGIRLFFGEVLQQTARVLSRRQQTERRSENEAAKRRSEFARSIESHQATPRRPIEAHLGVLLQSVSSFVIENGL